MLIKENGQIKYIIKEGWHEWKIIAPIFAILTILSSALLMTSLPKEAILLGTFFASITIPALIIFWKERRNKSHHVVISPFNIPNKIDVIKWKNNQECRDIKFYVGAHPYMHKEKMPVKATS